MSHYDEDLGGDEGGVSEHLSPTHLIIDQEPDEHGNVMLAASFSGGRMITLGFNVN